MMMTRLRIIISILGVCTHMAVAAGNNGAGVVLDQFDEPVAAAEVRLQTADVAAGAKISLLMRKVALLSPPPARNI